jgi:hypothetical protein
MRELILIALLAAAPVASPQEPAAASPTAPSVPTSDADREAYLLKAEIAKRKPAPGGITNSERATLRQGAIEHDAHIQAHDEYKATMSLSSGTELDFRDSFRNNVAAYRLDRILGLRMIPVTVVRNVDQKPASFTWWVDRVKMDEKKRFQQNISSPDATAWNHQIFVVRVFDQLIYNVDRNLGNLLIDEDWRIWMIDHTRAFKVFKDLKTPKNLGDHCERKLLAALRGLDANTLKAEMKDLLSPPQIDGLLARRDRIVAYYDEKIAALGEDKVLYDLETTFTGTVATRP